MYYVVQATANDGDLLDLDNIELSQSSVVMATDPDTGAQVEYATLRSSNSPVSYTHLDVYKRQLQSHDLTLFDALAVVLTVAGSIGDQTGGHLSLIHI